MKIMTTYNVKLKTFNHANYNRIFKDTVVIYRKAVDYLIDVCLKEWDSIKAVDTAEKRVNYVESLIHKTKVNPNPKYDFDKRFYKFPSYLRRAVISESIGKVSSYKSNLKNWEANPVGKAPSEPRAGFAFPSMYKDNMYEQTGTYTAKVKAWCIIHGTGFTWI